MESKFHVIKFGIDRFVSISLCRFYNGTLKNIKPDGHCEVEFQDLEVTDTVPVSIN